jgi:hypothetical protein
LRFISAPEKKSSERRLGQFPSRPEKFFTESVENPVEKTHETRIAVRQSEEISGLHYRGAIHSRVNRGRQNRRIIL